VRSTLNTKKRVDVMGCRVGE
jgi:transposase